MRFNRISQKQFEIFKFMAEPYDALICDGAVRTGKTIMMIIAFVDWAMGLFDGCNFGVCGKTVRSAERNVVSPFMVVASIRKKYKITYSRTLSLMTVRRGTVVNYFYLFGGKDESSYMLIQGITLSGALFDEVALMTKSFVEQAIARTLSVDNAKLWFNCNPENPAHWFYNEWVKAPDTHNAKRLHFLMEDNPSLSEVALKKAQRNFAGVFYKRYVLGIWCAAEGACYPLFAADIERYILKLAPPIVRACIGVDFGGGTSGHAFCCTGQTHRMENLVVLEEYFCKDALDPARLEQEFVTFVKHCKQKYVVYDVWCDSAEQTLTNGLRIAAAKNKLGVNVDNARKKPINERIRAECILMASDRFKVMHHCRHTIDALQSAVYDNKKTTQDVRLDNNSSNIDSLDAMEYSFERYIDDLIERW